MFLQKKKRSTGRILENLIRVVTSGGLSLGRRRQEADKDMSGSEML